MCILQSYRGHPEVSSHLTVFLIKDVVKSELCFRKVPLVITCGADGGGSIAVGEAILEA